MPRSKTTKNTNKKTHKTPKLRLHKPSGQGFVVLNGGKPTYLGRYDLDTTEEAYHRVIAEWKANGCKPPAPPPDITIVELADRFWTYAKAYYVDRSGKPTTSQDNYRAAHLRGPTDQRG